MGELRVCPHCGEDFPDGRAACPHCGSDAETGWSEDGITGYSTSLPDEFTDDDYDDVLRGMGELPPKQRFPTWMVVVAIVTAIAFLLLVV